MSTPEGRFQAAWMARLGGNGSGDRPVWSASEITILSTPLQLPANPSIADLFVQLVAAEGAPDTEALRKVQLDRRTTRITLDVASRDALLQWAEFLGLRQRSERLERLPDSLAVIRSGRVIVGGHRVHVSVGWRLSVQEIGA